MTQSYSFVQDIYDLAIDLYSFVTTHNKLSWRYCTQVKIEQAFYVPAITKFSMGRQS